MSPSKKPAITNDNPTKGSPTPGEPLYIPVGRFGRPFSYHGAVTFYPEEEFRAGIQAGMTLYLASNKQVLRVTSAKPHGKGFLLHLAESHSDLEAGKLTNQVASVPADQVPPLNKGEYYQHQILGLQVINTSGEVIGTLKEILATGANDVFVVIKGDGGEVLLPVIASVVKKVDLKKGVITVDPPEWD